MSVLWQLLKRAWLALLLKPRLRTPAATQGPNLTDVDVLSRFLTSSGHFARGKKRVKGAAFLPAADKLTSTFHTTGLDAEAKWRLGDAHLAGRHFYGSGDVTVGDVRAVGLDVDPNYEPERHVGIWGWPNERQEQMSLAQQLAATATLSLRPQ